MTTATMSRRMGDADVAIEKVLNHPLPERVRPLVDSYESVVGDRDEFLWKWAHHLFPEFTLSCIDPRHTEQVHDAKLVGLMFVSILDDVAEKHGDRVTFEEAKKIPFDHQSVNHDRDGVDRELLRLATDIWNEFSATIRDGPRTAEFEDLLRYDLTQVFNAIDYAYLVNANLEFTTGSELRAYDAHDMMLYGFADIDLVHSPGFDRSDMSTLRRVLERAQRMVRIGNWVTTWERELSEGDFTSGIVVYALENGIVSIDDLRASRTQATDPDMDAIVEAIHEHDVEDVFLRRWDDELAAARTFEGDVDSVDVAGYLDGIETIMDYHLTSRGLK